MSDSHGASPSGAKALYELALLAGAPHGASLIDWAQGAKKIRVIVSFLFPEGVRLVGELLKHAPVDLTVSTYLRATRKAALLELLALLKSSPGLRVRVATGDKDGFHGKVYRYTYDDGTARIVVGSANLTQTGLHGHGEVSLTAVGPQGSMPKLGRANMPALRDPRWATMEDPAALKDVLRWYRERKLGAELGEAVVSDVASFVEIGESSPSENAFIEFVWNAPDGDREGRMEGDPAPADEQFIINPAKDGLWATLAGRLELGDVVFLAWDGEKTLNAHRLLARYTGKGPKLKRPRIVLFLKAIPQANFAGTTRLLVDRMVPREELPKKVLAALAAELTTLETDT
jgi:hypothetical protein